MDDLNTGAPAVVDASTYRWVAVSLRTGMYASLTTMIGGNVWWLLAGSPGGRATGSRVVPFDELVFELLALNPLAFMNLGVLLLLSTPGVTLLVQIITFSIARNWRYAGISTVLTLILMISLVLAIR